MSEKDKAGRLRSFGDMNKPALLTHAVNLYDAAHALREYIDAIPQDINLPAMPGMDRDYIDSIIDKK